jgi:alanine racemase
VRTGAICENLRRIRRAAKTKILFVVKADAYGHGAVAVCREVEAKGAAQWLGVSSVEEGAALRAAGIELPILILGSLFPFESVVAAARHGLTPTVASLEGARRVAEAAERLGRAKGGASIPCHLKLDTGMGRVGVRWPAGQEVAEFLARSPGVALQGVYTHLACAESGQAYTRLQLDRFAQAVGEIERLGVPGLLRHAANSAAALRTPESRWDMVRPGLAAYGVWPGFEPALSLKTRIVFLKNVGGGTPISYGASYRTPRPTRIATLPIGYADGLPRLLSRLKAGSRGGEVLIRGRRCPIVGAVTMDMTMIDVGAVPDARVGDEVILIGRSQGEEVSACDWAGLAGTISYEILTGIQARVPRVHMP